MFSTKSLLLLLTIYGVRGSKKFRSDYSYHADVDGWLKFHKVPGTWDEARNRCYMEGAVLASPVDVTMQNALRDELIKSSTECAGFYIGVHSIFSKGYFFSLEGEPLSKMPVQWLPGEPDNVDNNEDCIAYVDGRVADVNCSEILPFVCYKKNIGNMAVMPCGTIDRAYEYKAQTGSCYKFHAHQTWRDAFKICSAEGGYLAIINSREEAAVVKEIYSLHYPNAPLRDATFIGFLAWDKDRIYRTVHGQTIIEAGYTDWETEQPDNADPGQHCGAIYPNAKLHDYWCDQPSKFLCEKDPESLQDYSPTSSDVIILRTAPVKTNPDC